MKKITLHWLNFLVIFLVIFLLGVVIGFMVIPHSSVAEKETPEKAEVLYEVDSLAVVTESAEVPVKETRNITPPKLMKRVEPVYPEAARQARVEGTVILEVTTDIYGRVKNTKILRSVPLLDQAAIDAVLQWEYEPMLIDREPKGVIFTITVVFKLK